MSDQPEVGENLAEHRFEVWSGGELAGFTVYERRGDTYAFVHTEIDGQFEGQGLGSVLVRHALDDMRARSAPVLPFCPFVRRFLARHGDYLSLVPPAERARFGLPAGDGAATS